MSKPNRWPEIALLTLLIARLWLMLLPSGLWTDETATAFVAAHSADPSLAIVSPYTQSIYYLLPRAMHALIGFSEIGYRIPSVLAMALALFFVARLAATVIDADAAWFALFACLSIPGIDYFAVDAKPYALGMCCAAAAVFFLARWLDSARWTHAILFLIPAALLWRVHEVYWAFYPVFALYALWRIAKKQSAVSLPRLLIAFTVLTLALLPVALHSLALLHEADTHAFADPPTAAGLWHFLRPGVNLVLICGIAAWLLARLRRAQPSMTRRGSSIALVLAWWLLTPATIFIFSRISRDSLFVPRYLSLSLPGIALTVTIAVALFLPRSLWRCASIAMAIAALANAGNWRALWPEHDPADWRPVADYANHSVESSDTPILCISPFIEAQPPFWRPDYPMPGFLYSQLVAYPLRGKEYLLPFQPSDAARDYVAALATSTLPRFRRFLIYGSKAQAEYWRDWLARSPDLATWKSDAQDFGEIRVVIFDR